MALLAAAQFQPPLWQNGDCQTFILFSVRNVSAGDTLDLSGLVRVILQTAWMSATSSGVAAGTFTGTTVTAPAGLTNAGAYLFVQAVPI